MNNKERIINRAFIVAIAIAAIFLISTMICGCGEMDNQELVPSETLFERCERLYETNLDMTYSELMSEVDAIIDDLDKANKCYVRLPEYFYSQGCQDMRFIQDIREAMSSERTREDIQAPFDIIYEHHCMEYTWDRFNSGR
jgi:hypothetical protein